MTASLRGEGPGPASSRSPGARVARPGHGELAVTARQGAQAELAQAIANGDSLEAAICRCTRALAATEDWRDLNTAWALAEGVATVPGGETAAALGRVIVLHRRRQLDRTWSIVRGLDDATLAREVPVEAVDAATAARSPEATRRATAIAARIDRSRAPLVVDLAGRLLAAGGRADAATLVAGLDEDAGLELDPRRRDALDLLRRWLAAGQRTIPAGAVPFAVLGSRTPDCAAPGAANLGPAIESLATLGNLVRLADVTFTGDDGLGELATELQARVDAPLRVAGVTGAIHLIGIDRDFSRVADIPDPTWVIAAGRHGQPLYDGGYDFPYHPGLRPLFVSFSVDEVELLGEEALAYLRRYGPVGCRDWTTVFLLLSAGVDAFFTGAVTTTVDAVVPPAAARPTAGATAWIDVPGPKQQAGRSGRVYTHHADASRVLPVADALRAADDRLAAYRRDVGRAVTGRLQAFLALASLGIPVELRPRSPGDVRLAGLAELRPGDGSVEVMRDDIRQLTAGMLATILGGASEDEVYASWRARTADRVAEARARFDRPASVPPTTIDVAAAISTTLGRAVRSGPHADVRDDAVADVVLAFDENLLLPAGVLVESMVAHASGPLRLWVLGRGLPTGYASWLAGAFPALPITVLACDDISYGPAGRPRRIPARITISTMDRLLLPDLLPDVRRIVYVDVDTLLLDDICRLVRTDLGGRPVAARDTKVSEDREWRRAGRHLPIEVATDLRRTMGRRHGFGHPALNAGVLVMDLDRMRRDGFTATAFGLVEHYGLNDQDTMLAYVGPERCVLDPAWNALPILEDVVDPRLIHWASLGKPWEPERTFGQAAWRGHASRLLARAGPPPVADGPPTPAAG